MSKEMGVDFGWKSFTINEKSTVIAGTQFEQHSSNFPHRLPPQSGSTRSAWQICFVGRGRAQSNCNAEQKRDGAEGRRKGGSGWRGRDSFGKPERLQETGDGRTEDRCGVRIVARVVPLAKRVPCVSRAAASFAHPHPACTCMYLLVEEKLSKDFPNWLNILLLAWWLTHFRSDFETDYFRHAFS